MLWFLINTWPTLYCVGGVGWDVMGMGFSGENIRHLIYDGLKTRPKLLSCTHVEVSCECAPRIPMFIIGYSTLPPLATLFPSPPMKSLSFSCFKVSLYMYKTKQRNTFSNHSKLGIVKDSNLVAAVPRMKERNPSWRLTSPFVFWFLRPRDVEIPCNYRNSRTLGACMSCCSWLLVIINHNSSCIRTNCILTDYVFNSLTMSNSGITLFNKNKIKRTTEWILQRKMKIWNETVINYTHIIQKT